MGAIYNRKAIYQEITNQIVEILKQGKIPWQDTWVSSQSNYETKAAYHGFNQFFLNLMMNYKKYKFPYWLTFLQAKKLGGKVKKGEKGTLILFYSPYIPANSQSMCKNCHNSKECNKKNTFNKIKIETRQDIDNLCEDYSPVWKSILKSHVVFNIEQTTLEIKESSTEEYLFNLSKIKKVLENYIDMPPILEGGTRAAYNWQEDYIKMPIKKLFFTEESYYATLFHELVHSTGYEKRLNRQSLYSTKGDELYAYEELIAELGAMFLCAEAGMKNEKRIENSSAYIQSWIKVLKDNPDWIFKASNEAQKAVNYIISKSNLYQNQKVA